MKGLQNMCKSCMVGKLGLHLQKYVRMVERTEMRLLRMICIATCSETDSLIDLQNKFGIHNLLECKDKFIIIVVAYVV